MRKAQKERLRGFVGILLIFFAVAGFIGWENYGREAMTYQPVIVFKEEVQKGTIVEKQMLGLMMMEKAKLIDQPIIDPDKIIGQRTNTYIPGHLQLCSEFFSDPELVTGDGNYVFSMPMDWVYAYPQTLRRGDSVSFYSIDKELAQQVEDMASLNDMDTIEGIDTKSFGNQLMTAKIAYVKDSSNREVIDVTPDRIDGSAAVSQIELVISEEKYQKLKTAAEKNQVFILMYE
ncbi:hypothetical protein [Anaerovorax sp. IOR16]|uniref:hypothetical protein n=1 Tax=Anaerovorax sp. IOR16 TaxID=2773458 RepID=UPI0019D032C2|nr:hypothetical protein [Anaerovorax sp. IOR16]